MSIIQHKKSILIVMIIMLCNYYTLLTAQETKITRSGITKNKCISYNLGISFDYAEINNIAFRSENIRANGPNTYLISKPLRIESTQQNPFTAFSYVLFSEKMSDAEIDLFYSTSADNITYTVWTLLETEINDDSCIYSQMAFLDKTANYLKYKIVFKTYPSSITLRKIKLSFINPGITTPEMQKVIDAKDKGIKTTMPKVITRTEWGCNDGENAPLWTPQYTIVTHLVIHHTAGSNNISQDYAATVRSIWSQHTYTNNWGDIGYNFLIDAYGKVYEGRAGGNNAIGAHCGFNGGTMGVSVMGTYTSELPTDTSTGTLKQLLAWKCTDSKINPLGNGFHTSSGKDLSVICGHRDVKSTECPGNALYAELPEIRNEVNELIKLSPLTQNDINCYPNPFREILQLDIKHINWKYFTIEISDIYGRIIYNTNVSGFESGIKQLNLGTLSNGIYYLRIVTPTDILFKTKIIKSR